jgi:hypothetical protein
MVLGVADYHLWTPSPSGIYSSKSAYSCLFIGVVNFEPTDGIWKMWAPSKCKWLLWLVAQNRRWTADRFARWGLGHSDKCPLCEQEDKTVQHLLASCVFAKEV